MNLGRVQRKRIEETNTFTKRPVATQIIAYLIVLFELLVFTICVQANIVDQAPQIILMVLYYSSFLAMVVSWIVTSKTNPSDSLLRRNRGQINAEFPDCLLLYCQKCRKIVQQASLHCKICDTCVQNFDHHCVWINNCIGKKNYKVFIVMIASISVNFVLFVAGAAILWSQGNWESYRSSIITVWVTSAIVSVFACLLLVLVAFHAYLIATGKTTYQFFMQKKQARVVPQHFTQNLVIDAEMNRSSINQMKGNPISKTQIGLAKGNDSTIVGVENMIGQQQHERSISEYQQSKLKESGEKQSEKECSISMESKPSQTINQVSMIKKNKSIDYIIGRLCVDEQPRKNQRGQSSYQSLKYNNANPHPRKIKPLDIK